MSCILCCSERTHSYIVNGREVGLCFGCWWDHLDFPRLAASLEAAKGRKCIDPGCEAHNPKPYSIAEEAKRVKARLKQLGREQIEQFREFCMSPHTADLPTAELKLCTCGHPYPHHGGAEHRCYEDCPCEVFTESTVAKPKLCVCGHEIGWHYPKAPTRCGWQESKGAPDCPCEGFTEATNAKS